MSAKAKAEKKSSAARKNLAKVSRWLHIYLSMFCFILVFFFAFTGLTLNHPSWLGGDKQYLSKEEGNLNKEWVNDIDTAKVRKLEVVEFLRNKHQVKGALSEFRIDDVECSLSFKGPAYSSDVFVDRETGNYEISEIRMGIMAVMNDLHKGRDSGREWAWLIDLSAIFLMLVSLSGLILLFFIKKKRFAGVITGFVGLILSYLIYLLFVP